MEYVLRKVNRWEYNSIRPGPVGSVGDANMAVRLKQSAPELAPRYDPIYSGKKLVPAGANISDGFWHGYISGGRVARTLCSKLEQRQGFKTAVGWVIEDLRPADTTRQPIMGSTGQWGWKNKVATVYKAKVRGQMFLPVPQGYSGVQTELPRGSQIPQIVAQSTGESIPETSQKSINPVTGEITFTGGAMAPAAGAGQPMPPVGTDGPKGDTCAPNTQGLLPDGFRDKGKPMGTTPRNSDNPYITPVTSPMQEDFDNKN